MDAFLLVWAWQLSKEADPVTTTQQKSADDAPERCILVGLDSPDNWGFPIDESLDELANLAESAGALEVGRVVQPRVRPDPSTYLGSGKVQEVADLCASLSATLVIFDDELSPAQSRNLERSLDVRVVDRTQIILDIFAQRARTKEGKIQVEMAQLRYVLPRLSGIGASLSRLGGGIGTRGPGETKLEVDRRRIRSRMADLRRELVKVERQRSLQRDGRESALATTAALVGYTNAGKSTLFNRLTGSDVYSDDRLFATLDPTIRNLELPSGRKALLIDSVGFIRKLPHDLVAAFRATLEEIAYADVLVHVVDVSASDWYERGRAVFDVLEHLGASEKPVVTAFNKIDCASDESVAGLLGRVANSVAVSAMTGQGIGQLLRAIEEAAPDPLVRWEFVVPYAEAQVASWIHTHGRVLREEYEAGGVRLVAEMARPLAARVERFRADGNVVQ